MIDCSKCPERGCCCGPFPMKKGFLEKFKSKFQKQPEKIGGDEKSEIALCMDGLCVFLNRETKLCAIYEDRPEVCKLFGICKDKRLQCVFFKPSGNLRSEASKKQVLRCMKVLEKELWGDLK